MIWINQLQLTSAQPRGRSTSSLDPQCASPQFHSYALFCGNLL
jgi:hypothetical protein